MTQRGAMGGPPGQSVGMSPSGVRSPSSRPADYHPADIVEMALEWGHPLTIEGLARRCNLPIRAVQAGIEELRRRGKPVVSTGRGIHLTHDGDELMDSYRRLRSRALHQLANLRAMQRTARAMSGVTQLPLFEDVA